MKKEKDTKENWCPLMGDIGPPGGLYEGTIERARYFWGTKATANRDSNGDVIQCFYRPCIATIKKARRIYDAWMFFRDEENKAWGEGNEACQTLNLLCSADENMRQTYIEDIHIKFRIANINDVSPFEVLTIIVIAEANENIKIDENSALPFTLLRIAEDFNPNTIIGAKHRKTQKTKRDRRQIYKGKTPSERQERNHKMLEHYKKTNLTLNSFAGRHAKKYDLKPISLRKILEELLLLSKAKAVDI